MRKFNLGLLLLCLLFGASLCFAEGAQPAAQTGSIEGVKTIAQNVRSNLGDVVQLLTALAFVAGIAFAIGGVVKFKAHKDNPTQVQISVPISLLFIGAALIFIPGVFTATGTTLFGGQGKFSSTSGFSTLEGVGGGTKFEGGASAETKKP